MTSQQSVLHRSKGTQPQQKQITLVPRPKQSSTQDQQEDEVAKEFTSSRHHQQKQRNNKNEQGAEAQDILQAKHLVDIFTTQSVDGSLKKQLKLKTQEGVQKEQVRRFLSGNGSCVNEKANENRQQQSSLQNDNMNFFVAPNERLAKMKPNNIKISQQQVLRTSNQNKNMDSNHFSDSGQNGQSLSGFLNNSTGTIQQHLNQSSTSLNSNLNQVKMQIDELKQSNTLRPKLPSVLHVDPSQGSTSASNNFLLPSHLIIANGPNTYAAGKHTHIGDISSFEILTQSSSKLNQGYQLISDEKKQNNKQKAKISTDQTKQKTFMTPQRNQKKVPANRGIVIANANIRKTSQINQTVVDQSDSINASLNNANQSVNQIKSEKNKALQLYSQYLISQTKTGFAQSDLNYQQTLQNQVILSPKNSVINGITKVGGLAALRASTNSLHSNKTNKHENHIQVQLNGQSKEKLVIDKSAYKDLMNYLVKAESKRIDSEKRNDSQNLNNYTAMSISSFTNSKFLSKPNNQTGQKLKLQTSQQSKNAEMQMLQATQQQKLSQAIQRSQTSPTKQQIQLKNPNLQKQIQMPNGTISSNFSRHSIQLRATQQNNPKINIAQSAVIKLRSSTSKEPQVSEDHERNTSQSSLKFQKQTPQKIPAKSIKSRNLINGQALTNIGGTLPMPLTQNNLIIKQFVNLQRSDANDSDLNANAQNRLSLEFINASIDNNINTANSFKALKNNFIEEISASKHKQNVTIYSEEQEKQLENQAKDQKFNQKISLESNGLQKVNIYEQQNKKKNLLKQKNSSKKLKNLQLKPQALNGQDKILSTKSSSVKYKDLIKKVPNQGGIINAAIAQEVFRNLQVDASESIGENYAVLRNSSRTRGSASLPRKSREESSLNISSPKNLEGSQKSGRLRKKSNKSGNDSNVNPSMSLRNTKSHVAVSKIIKLNRKVLRQNEQQQKKRPFIDGLVSHSFSSVENQAENSTVSKSFENVGNSSGHINNADKLNSGEVIHAVQRYSDQPQKIKLAMELPVSAEEIAQELRKNIPNGADFVDQDPMIGGNFNTFGEHAPNLFTQPSDDEDAHTELKFKPNKQKPRYTFTNYKQKDPKKPVEAIQILKLNKKTFESGLKNEIILVQTPKLATEFIDTYQVASPLNSVEKVVIDKNLHQVVSQPIQAKILDYQDDSQQRPYADTKVPEFHYSGSFGVPDSPVAEQAEQLQPKQVTKEQRDNLIEQLESFDYSQKETQIFNPGVLISDYSDHCKVQKRSKEKTEFQLVNMSFSQQSIQNEEKVLKNVNKKSLQIMSQQENLGKEQKESISNPNQILKSSCDNIILQQCQNWEKNLANQEKNSINLQQSILRAQKNKFVKDKLVLNTDSTNLQQVMIQQASTKDESLSSNDRKLLSEQRKQLVVSKSAIQLLQSINHSLGLTQNNTQEEKDSLYQKPEIAVKLLVTGVKSNHQLGSFDAELSLADQDETNTVVENECDNDYNNILDEDSESLTHDFTAQNSIKIPSPISETNAKHLDSVKNSLSQNESSSINSKTLVGLRSVQLNTGKNSTENSQDGFFSSRKNSNSEQVLSSRVDQIASGQVSGRISNHILYSPVSEELSGDGNEEQNIESSVRNSSQKDYAPESQLLRYCLEKDVAIRNFNSKHKNEVKKINYDDGSQVQDIESSDSEDFENLPEFEQSFQTMRADDEAVESYGDEHGIFFQNTMFLQSQQTDCDQQYQSEVIEEPEKFEQQQKDSYLRFASHGQKGAHNMTSKIKIQTNQTTKKVSDASSVNHHIQIQDDNMVSSKKYDVDMYGQPNFDFIESSGKHEEFTLLQNSEIKEDEGDETEDKYQFVRNLNKQFQGLLK